MTGGELLSDFENALLLGSNSHYESFSPQMAQITRSKLQKSVSAGYGRLPDMQEIPSVDARNVIIVFIAFARSQLAELLGQPGWQVEIVGVPPDVICYSIGVGQCAEYLRRTGARHPQCLAILTPGSVILI
jgi:hypothetical protein